MVTSKQLVVLGVVVIVVLVPIAAVGFLIFPPDFAYSHTSTYSYTTSLSTNTTIENVTVHLPFPAGADVEADALSDLWIYDDNGTELTDWDTAIVQTDRGPMLRLNVDRVVGEDRYILWTYAPNGSVVDREEIGSDEIPEDMSNRELSPDPTRYSISWHHSVDYDIETRYPIGNASFLAPITDVATADCEYRWDDSDACWDFATVAAATYEAPNPATVVIDEIRFEAWNEWGFWLSNSFNTFEATTSPAIYVDGRQGWTHLDGHLHAGMGRYDGPSR
ncbi:hypothetical protein ACFQFH_01315 [Halobaculum halobium]|uniref:Uncharacterized protein n=1 Tax=Halobaculum halobium TaxID=3032281 RepID=A0ABD5T5M9_9EURY|nr:hypothetical protein [Halobaculum sp. SYNS20]